MRPLPTTSRCLWNSTHHGGKFTFLREQDRLARFCSFRIPARLDHLNSGHCKNLAPEYAKAAKTMATWNPPQYLAKVDATENKEVAARFEVKGFPTLHFFR